MMKRSTLGKMDWTATKFTAGKLLPSWSMADWRCALGLALAVVVVYLPVWRAGFVWDDRLYITENPSLHGLSGLAAIWTSSAADISPLTSTVFWVEHALWGLAPLPYHLVNVFQHAACAVVLWRVLLALRVPGAWLGAALWALHPVQVESVAWVSEMKNTQSGLFFLLSVLFFLGSLAAKEGISQAGERWSYPLSLLFGGLAMASKSSTVILPAVLCLAAWWLEGPWRWRNLARVAPFLVLAAAASALSLWTQALALSTLTDPQWARSGPERLVTAGIGVWFYLGKELWPYRVMTFYPRWQIDAGEGSSYLPLVAVIVTLVLLWLKRDSWARPGFFVFAYFLVALSPVLGLVDNYIFQYSLVFDHFQYLASMGPLALAGAGLVRLADHFTPGKVGLLAGLSAGWLLLFGLLSWQRAMTFESEEVLWTDTIEKNPGSSAAHFALGVQLAKKGQVNAAITEYRTALAINPRYGDAGNNIGLLLLDRGEVDQAITELQTVLKANPNSDRAHNTLGIALLQKKKKDEALAQFRLALKVNPNFASADYNIGAILFDNGDVDGTIEVTRKALAVDPNSAGDHLLLGHALAQKGQIDAAIAEFRKTVEIDPDKAEAHNSLGMALAQKGQVEDAISEYRKVLAIQPDSYSVESNLGVALFQTGQGAEGMEHLQRAAKLSPNSPEALSNLGNGFLATGRLDDAVAQYRKALAIDPDFFGPGRNLAVALLYQGKLDEGIAQLQAVLRLHPNDEATKGILAHAQALARQKAGQK